MDAIATAVTTGISEIATSALSAMGKIVPAALPVLGGFLIVKVAKKVYSTVAGK